MSSYLTLLKLNVMLMCRGDRMLYLYFVSLIAYVAFRLNSFELVSQVFLTISNVYLALLYGHDRQMKVFYHVLSVSEFKIHSAKLFLIYFLSLIELFVVIVLSPKIDYAQLFVEHFLTFYAAMLFYNFPNWGKLVAIMGTFIAIDILLSLFSPVIISVLIVCATTALLLTILNEQTGFKKTHPL